MSKEIEIQINYRFMIIDVSKKKRHCWIINLCHISTDGNSFTLLYSLFGAGIVFGGERSSSITWMLQETALLHTDLHTVL